MYCLCVDVYCTAATGCQPNCSLKIYQYQYSVLRMRSAALSVCEYEERGAYV